MACASTVGGGALIIQTADGGWPGCWAELAAWWGRQSPQWALRTLHQQQHPSAMHWDEGNAVCSAGALRSLHDHGHLHSAKTPDTGQLGPPSTAHSAPGTGHAPVLCPELCFILHTSTFDLPRHVYVDREAEPAQNRGKRCPEAWERHVQDEHAERAH